VLVKTKEPRIDWHISRREGTNLSTYLAKVEHIAREIAAGHFRQVPLPCCSVRRQARRQVKRVFVDAGGFFALLCAEDRSHERARELFAEADAQHWRLVMTNAVVMETHALLVARLRDGQRHGIEFLDRLTRTQLRVERVRASDEKRAIELIRRHADKDYSLCDALSFVVMERLKLKEAIAFDRHFREYGSFVVL
jgi:predicted nucleic acid-binding protein